MIGNNLSDLGVHDMARINMKKCQKKMKGVVRVSPKKLKEKPYYKI